MDNTTMTMNAVTCVLSVRPRVAGPVRNDAALLMDQGTALPVVALAGDRLVGSGAGVRGQVSVEFRAIAPTYTTSDVVRSRSGRPPV